MLARFWSDFGQISPKSGGVSLESLFEGYFGEKKNQKWSRASINDGLTERVPTLRDFETFGRYIVNF
jgi:hypothetical protein